MDENGDDKDVLELLVQRTALEKRLPRLRYTSHTVCSIKDSSPGRRLFSNIVCFDRRRSIAGYSRRSSRARTGSSDTSPEAVLDATASMRHQTHAATPQLRPTSDPERVNRMTGALRFLSRDGQRLLDGAAFSPTNSLAPHRMAFRRKRIGSELEALFGPSWHSVILSRMRAS